MKLLGELAVGYAKCKGHPTRASNGGRPLTVKAGQRISWAILQINSGSQVPGTSGSDTSGGAAHVRDDKIGYGKTLRTMITSSGFVAVR
jgi:hypothetical protein